jgi:hypothetical protein
LVRRLAGSLPFVGAAGSRLVLRALRRDLTREIFTMEKSSNPFGFRANARFICDVRADGQKVLLAIKSMDMAPAFERSKHHEEVGGPVALVLVIENGSGVLLSSGSARVFRQ